MAKMAKGRRVTVPPTISSAKQGRGFPPPVLAINHLAASRAEIDAIIDQLLQSVNFNTGTASLYSRNPLAKLIGKPPVIDALKDSGWLVTVEQQNTSSIPSLDGEGWRISAMSTTMNRIESPVYVTLWELRNAYSQSPEFLNSFVNALANHLWSLGEFGFESLPIDISGLPGIPDWHFQYVVYQESLLEKLHKAIPSDWTCSAAGGKLTVGPSPTPRTKKA